MLKIVITDSNILIKLVIIFEGILDLNCLTSVQLYIPSWVVSEVSQLKRDRDKQQRIGSYIALIEKNIVKNRQLPEPSEAEIGEGVKSFEVIHQSLVSSGIDGLSDPLSRIDVKLLLMAQKNKVYLITNEGSLFFFGSNYYEPEKTLRLSNLLIEMHQQGEVSVDHLKKCPELLADKGEHMRRDDRNAIHQYLKDLEKRG